MAAEKAEVFTAGKIAEALKASPAAVKKTIQTLGIKPVMQKGACSYYGKDVLAKVKAALK